jgi:hypothetical protein
MKEKEKKLKSLINQKGDLNNLKVYDLIKLHKQLSVWSW